MRDIRISVAAAFVLAASAGAAGKAQFVDYYASASGLVAALNGLAADVERLNLRSGSFSEEDASATVARLVKAREGFASLLPNNGHTSEINEGYILYIDKVLLAVMLAREYRKEGGQERLDRLDVLLVEAAALRAKLNQTIQKDKKLYGVP